MSCELPCHPGIVYTVYAAAFVPLAFIYGMDFITDRWRPIRKTWQNGMTQLCISLPCLAYVMYYIALQIGGGDHKEAASAITVAVFNAYHVFRTVWGLLQLSEFRNWNVHALNCLINLRYKASDHPPSRFSLFTTNLSSRVRDFCFFWTRGTNALDDELGTSDKSLDTSGSSLEDVERTVDNEMFVNSSLIDNEIAGHDLPMCPVLHSRVEYSDQERHGRFARFVASHLRSTLPEECAVRWLVSFLAKFGSRWLADTKHLSDATCDGFRSEELWSKSRDLAVVAMMHTTNGMVTETGSTENFVSLFSPFHEFCIAPNSCVDSRVDVSEIHSLPFQMNGYENTDSDDDSDDDSDENSDENSDDDSDDDSDENSDENSDEDIVFDFDRQEATIKDAVRDDWHKASLNKLDDEERTAVENMSAAQLACFAKLMHQDQMFCKIPDVILPDVKYSEDLLLRTFTYQLGGDYEQNNDEILKRLPFALSGLQCQVWSPNNGVFQESIHMDNYVSLECGDRSDSSFETLQLTTEEDGQRSAFQQQVNLETARLQANSMTPGGMKTSRFIGCVTEIVRSALAEWVEKYGNDTTGWSPRISTMGLSFPCSAQLCSTFQEIKKNNTRAHRWNMRLVWEIQSFLRWKVGKEVEQLEENDTDLEEIEENETDLEEIEENDADLEEIEENDADLEEIEENDADLEEIEENYTDLRRSEALVMLFILGFPSVRIEHYGESESTVTESIDTVITLENDRVLKFTVAPISGPQKIVITVELNVEAKRVSLRMELEGPVFDWQGWKDTFMGSMCAQKRWRLSRGISKHETLREEGNQSQLSESIQENVFFNFWAGWPPFMPEIAQYEFTEGLYIYTPYIEGLNSALDAHYHSQSREEVGPVYEDGRVALEGGRKNDAMIVFGRCIAEQGDRRALQDFADILLKQNPVNSDDSYRLWRDMFSWYKILINRRPRELAHDVSNEIDLQLLADECGRLLESTEYDDFEMLKAFSLFHVNGPENAVSEAAVCAMESILVKENDTFIALHLAIAYQSLYVESRDLLQRQLAVHAIVRAGIDGPYPFGAPLGAPLGMLLEKGFYTFRNKKHISALISPFYSGDGKRLQELFERLFLMPETPDGHIDGIGIHPKDAIRVYKKMLMKREVRAYAYNRLGLIYHRGGPDVPISISHAKSSYSNAIERGSTEALCNMGVLLNGNQAEGDNISSLRKAVATGNSTAKNNLGVAYDLGNGVKRNAVEAKELYEQAIEKDQNPIAIFNLALMYKFGDSEFRSEEKSAELIDQLYSPDIDTSGMFVLMQEISKFSNAATMEARNTDSWKVKLEEIDDCLAYVIVKDGE